MYTLSVIRLAPPEHSYMAELNVTIKGYTYSLCSDTPWAEAVPEYDDSGEPLDGVIQIAPPCQVEPAMQLNVSHDTETVLLHPSLLFPDVQVRVLNGDRIMLLFVQGSALFAWLCSKSAVLLHSSLLMSGKHCACSVA